VTAFIDPDAAVAADARIGAGTKVWGLAQVREGATIGDDCIVGRGAYVGAGVRIGDRVKIQNLALVYEPAVLESGVFVGPAAVLTNDQFPRAVTPSGEAATPADWQAVGVVVREGASIGARAVCVAPVTIGRWAMVGAGATVVEDVPDHALVVGTPARFLRWVGRAGRPLTQESDGTWTCPLNGETYVLRDGKLELRP
jgi:acetyltransferase-like isoleucine patch superfamily enzyme